MNCREVTGILDDSSIGAIDPAQLRRAEAHVATCPGCARAWNAQASIASLPDLALPAGLSASCRVLVAAPRDLPTRRAGHRMLIAGSLVALAAAAAIVTLVMRPTAPIAPEHGAQLAAPETKPVVVPGTALPPAVEAQPAYLAAVSTTAPAAVVAPAPDSSFTVRVVLPATRAKQLQDSSSSDTREATAMRAMEEEAQRVNPDDPSADEILQSFSVALLESLRRIPGLVLVDTNAPVGNSAARSYRVAIGPMRMSGPDGHVLRIDPRYVPIGVSAEQLQAGGSNIHRLSTGLRIDRLASCSGATPDVANPCNDLHGTVEQLVRMLREQVFPPEASTTQPLQARLRDRSLDSAQRFRALSELFDLQHRTAGSSLLADPGTVRAALELAANATPAQRAQVWRSLRGVGDNSLVEPMIASLSQDTDVVRFAAAEILAADFSDEPRARAALQAAAVNDPRGLVRALAERGLSGEAGWRRYVVSSLENPKLPPAERVEALVYELYPPGPVLGSALVNPDYWQSMQELLDDAALRGLAEALPIAGKVPAVNNLLGNVGARYSKNPVVVEMLLAYLDHGADPLGREAAAQVLALTHANEPAVRDALDKAIKSDPDPRVPEWIRQVMGAKAP